MSVEKKIRANVVCAICHETSHLTKDCPLRHDRKKMEESRKRDAAYLAFLDELEGKTPSKRVEEPSEMPNSANSTNSVGGMDGRELGKAEMTGETVANSVEAADSGVSPMEIDSDESPGSSANAGAGESGEGEKKKGETNQTAGSVPMASMTSMMPMLPMMPMMPMMPFMAPPPVTAEQQEALMHNMRSRLEMI